MRMTEKQGMLPFGLQYLEYVPNGASASVLEAMPILVFLHGLGEDGYDLNLLKKFGLPMLICGGLEVPYRVFCPQCPEGVAWNLIQIAELIKAQSKGIPSTVFLTGFSKGATATWKFAARFRNLLTGVIPVAGRWELEDAAQVATVPVLAIHGAMDERPSPAPMVDTITQLGGNAQIWVLEKQGHFICDSVYADQRLYDWVNATSLLREARPTHEGLATEATPSAA